MFLRNQHPRAQRLAYLGLNGHLGSTDKGATTEPMSEERRQKMDYSSAQYRDDDFDGDNPLGKPDVPDHVQDAIRTLIAWAGDDPDREGLRDTPKRVGRAWLEYCEGYKQDPAIHLSRIFEEVGGYDEIVLLKDIPFQSHCEHHLAPITGKAAIAYLPNKKVVGISKLARVLHGYAQRLQIQERLTAEVAKCIWDNLEPHGVAVVIEAQHGCMTGRGVRTPGVGMITSRVLGCFLEDQRSRKEVMSLMGY
ncbi:GTP cyclohydrolase I [Porphyrobacter sp. MBR-155]|jgi:GTP cyclohydrolase I